MLHVGHKGTIYCVAYSFNGEKFASGSADKCVIIWTEQHEGILKYNQYFGQLCSYGFRYGIWMIDQKSVNKQKVSSRICSCAWTRDGHFFALGFFTGQISIRNKSGEEKQRVEKPLGHPPAWTLCFCPNKMDDYNFAVNEIGQLTK
uniref:Intraflagellar transport protein 122 homolog n=1 Tax=Romanomermis culicivorax TaxID=13658 RepID=A0A915KSS4_ROMCU